MREVASQTAGAEGAPEAVQEAARLRSPARPRSASAHRRWWRDALRRRLLAAADLLAALLAAAVVVVPATGTAWGLLFAPAWLLVAKLLGLYDRDHRSLRHLTADEVPQIIAWAGIVTALLALLLPLTSAGNLGGLAAAAHGVAAALAAVILRSVARWAWWKRTPPERVGLLGDGEALASMRRKFGLFRDMHFQLATERPLATLGSGARRTEQLSSLALDVDRIVVASGNAETALVAELAKICRELQVKLSVVSPLHGRALPDARISRVADLPILEYNTADPSRSSLLLKRGFDLLVATAGLALFAPLLPLIALAIRLDSRGPIFFSQVRAGLGGRPFRMYKLRTMHLDAEERLEEVVDLRGLDEPVFKLRDDPRVTRVGRFLRRLSIDEVPQLFNVLVGEMSIVGPRPEQVELVERYSRSDRLRLSVKPGITGPMQINGRGELTFSERLAVELEYIENPSLSRDLRIIVHTLPAVVRGTGAF